ncbi:hypothetical protein [Bythopirellula polymerisocia]|nr:hypothetical protein [Bythopirellula polymerisocia]
MMNDDGGSAKWSGEPLGFRLEKMLDRLGSRFALACSTRRACRG